MDKAAAIVNIREQLAKGDIEAALQLLIEKLEPERRQMRDLSNRAIHAKAQLEKTQRDELQGIISFENSKLSYNQITQQIIGLVEEWENPAEAPASQKRKFTPQMIMVGVVLLAFMGLIAFKMIKRSNRVGTADACPKFEPKSMFNIMVLPFNSLNEPEKPNSIIQTQIVRRLDRMKGSFAKTIQTSIKEKDHPVKTDEDAIQSGQDCAAKLVIWGESEDLDPGGIIVTTNYKYLSIDEMFKFKKLSLGDQSEVTTENDFSNIPTRGVFEDTLSSLSSITSDGKLTGRLEDQFRLLFGVAAMQIGNSEDAIKILQSTSPPDSSSALLRDMALAESHLQMGDTLAAKKDYDRVLDTHPNYWFALNNRALLYYQAHDYTGALETVEQKLQEEPDNPAALTLRGAIRIQTKELKEAKEDLDRAKELNKDPEKQSYIRKKLELLEKEKNAEERRKTVAKKKLDDDGTNIEALVELAEANRNLGNYIDADKIANQIIKLEPSNLKGIAIKIETATKLDNTRERNVAIRKAENLDEASKNTILQNRPILRTILQESKNQ